VKQEKDKNWDRGMEYQNPKKLVHIPYIEHFELSDNSTKNENQDERVDELKLPAGVELKPLDSNEDQLVKNNTKANEKTTVNYSSIKKSLNKWTTDFFDEQKMIDEEEESEPSIDHETQDHY
jgi:hypothetical protein